MSARWSSLLPLVLASLALGRGASWPLAAALLPLLVLPFVAGPRFDVDPGRQALSSAIGAGAGYVLTSVVYEAEAGQLTDGWARLAAAALTAGAARALLIAPRGGQAPAAALGFLGLAFAGRAAGATNPAYPLIAASFLLGVPWALAGSGPRLPGARRALAGAALLSLALALGSGSTLALRELHAWARGRAHHTSSAWQPRPGISERMDLGSLDGLLDSDRRVLRVRGARVDYLRGTALDVYELGSWRRSEAAERELSVRLDAPPAPPLREIELIGGRRDRLFLPLDARAPSATPSAALIDDLGSAKAPRRGRFERVRFASGARDLVSIAAPRPSDLHVPRRLRGSLRALLGRWTSGAKGQAEALRAIERRLTADYGYSLHVSRPPNVDPVLDFLLRERRGHCEYFASALVLLARSAGIPARIVMGYRVSERSPFGYYVVRERNAHAWAEVWLDGAGWTTRDATPEVAQPNNREHEAGYAAASVDAFGVAYDTLTDWLGRRTLLESSLGWLAGCAVLALIVARGLRGRQRRRALAEDEAPLPFMQSLLLALARHGHERRPDEPLERLAARLPDAPVADLVRRYAALRYGGLGDREALAREALAAARALQAAPRRASARDGVEQA